MISRAARLFPKRRIIWFTCTTWERTIRTPALSYDTSAERMCFEKQTGSGPEIPYRRESGLRFRSTRAKYEDGHAMLPVERMRRAWICLRRRRTNDRARPLTISSRKLLRSRAKMPTISRGNMCAGYLLILSANRSRLAAYQDKLWDTSHREGRRASAHSSLRRDRARIFQLRHQVQDLSQDETVLLEVGRMLRLALCHRGAG